MHQAPVRTWMGLTDAFVHLDTVYKMTSVKVGGLQYLETNSIGFCTGITKVKAFVMVSSCWNSLSKANPRAEGVFMASCLDGKTRTCNSHANP